MAWLAGIESGNLGEFITATGSVDSTTKRTGNYALKCTGNCFSPLAIFAADEVSVRYYVRVNGTVGSTEEKISDVRSDTGQSTGAVGIKHVDTNNFEILITNNDGTDWTQVESSVSKDEWHLIEVTVKKDPSGGGSNGEIHCRVDGGTTADVTNGGAGQQPDELKMDNANGAENIWFDDIFAKDVFTFLGAGQIDAQRADEDSGDSGEDEFEDEAANAETFSAVNQDPIDETEYAIESSQVDANHQQLWGLTSIPNVGTINLVTVSCQAARGNGSGTEHRLRAKVSTSENSADLALDGTSRYKTFNPSTVPTNQSEIDNFQAGAWRNAGGREFFCYEHWVMVDHVPAVGGAVVKDIIGVGVIPFAR